MRGLYLALLVMLVAVSNANSAIITISIVHSYHKEYAWEQSLTSGLVDTLPQNAILDHFYLDTKRLENPATRPRRKKRWSI